MIKTFFFIGKRVILLKKENGKRIQGVHNNEQRRTKRKAKKQRNQEAMLRDKRTSIREEQSKKLQHQDKSKRVHWHKSIN